METKKELRKKMRAKRDALTEAQVIEKSQKILKNLLGTTEYKNAKKIFCYVSFEKEVDTFSIIRQAFSDGKEVAVPRVNGNQMEFYKIRSVEELQPGYYGILEPVTDVIEKELEGIIIIPGLVFDMQCNRIGYGGGFYDRYLNAHTDHALIKIALAYEFQMVSKIETEEHDQKMDRIVTPAKVLENKKRGCEEQ